MNLIAMIRRATGAPVETTSQTPVHVLRGELPPAAGVSHPTCQPLPGIPRREGGARAAVEKGSEAPLEQPPAHPSQPRPSASPCPGLTSPQQALYRALRESALRNESALVVGSASSGVAHVAREVGESRGQWTGSVVITGREEAGDLLGRRVAGGDGGSGRYEDSDFSRALAHGGYVIIEGLERALPRTRDLLMRILADREVPRGFGRAPFKVHRKTTLVALVREGRLDGWHPALLRKVFGLIVEVRDPETTPSAVPAGVPCLLVSDVLTADDYFQFVRCYAPEIDDSLACRLAVLHESVCRFAAVQPRLQAAFDGMSLRRLCDLLRDVPAEEQDRAFREQSRTLYGASDGRACELVERLVAMLAP